MDEQAAEFPYLASKNHSFNADNTLIAQILMIADSLIEEKETMVKVIVNLINKNN